MIRCRDIRFGYERATPILRELSWQVEKGQLVAVVGPNGAGKSTLVRLLLGLRPADAGQIWIADRPIESYSRREFARTVGAVLQEELLEFPFTVAEVVLLGRLPHLGWLGFESAHDRRVATDAMGQVAVAHLAARPLDALSGGERRRVFLARALAQEAPIILLDEPTSALDLNHQWRLFALLEELRTRGVTIVAAVHDLNLAVAHAAEVLLLDGQGGSISGPTLEVLTVERIRAVFGVEVEIAPDPASGKPRLRALGLSPSTTV